MKILSRKEDLALGFRTLAGLASSRTAAAGTAGLLMESDGERLVLRASDGEVTATHVIYGVKVEQPERILVDPVLASIVLDMSDETVTIALEGDGTAVQVLGQGKSYEVPTSDPDEFRGLEPEAGGTVLVVPAEVMKAAVGRVAFAVAREASRYAFHAILLAAGPDGQVEMVGSDGRRMALVRFKIEEPPEAEVKALVPKRALADFVKNIPGEVETVRLTFTPGRMRFEQGNTEVLAQIIQGKYPDYRAVIPKKTANRVEIPGRALEEALRRINLVSASDLPVAQLNFYAHGELEIQIAQGAKSGKESLQVKLEGPGGEIRLNPMFILEYLRVAGSEMVTFHFTDNQSPAWFQAGTDFVYVVQPVNL